MPDRPSARKTNRRARRPASRDHLLDVRIRTSTARRRRNEKLGRAIWLTLVVLGVGAALFFGARAALDRFFFENAEYTLRRITLDLDRVLTREEALDATGLREGGNIFSVDLAAVKAALLEFPQVESVRVERELPDHLSVQLTARKPVAWVAASGETGDPSASERSLLVDAGGFLMRPHHVLPEYFNLPAIYGVESESVQAGEILPGEDLRMALTLIDKIAHMPGGGVRIRTLDISRGYCIEVLTASHARIIFRSGDFDEQLQRLQRLLAHCQESGRTLNTVNLMVKRNTPVTFVVAAAPVSDAAEGTDEP